MPYRLGFVQSLSCMGFKGVQNTDRRESEGKVRFMVKDGISYGLVALDYHYSVSLAKVFVEEEGSFPVFFVS